MTPAEGAGLACVSLCTILADEDDEKLFLPTSAHPVVLTLLVLGGCSAAVTVSLELAYVALRPHAPHIDFLSGQRITTFL